MGLMPVMGFNMFNPMTSPMLGGMFGGGSRRPSPPRRRSPPPRSYSRGMPIIPSSSK